MNQVKNNSVANVLAIAGYAVLLIGISVGLWLGTTLALPVGTDMMTSQPHPLRWVFGGAVVMLSLIAGLILVGFAENLKLIQQLVDR